MENGHRVWKKYDTLYVDGEDFEEIGKAFEKVHTLGKGLIGEAPCPHCDIPFHHILILKMPHLR